jgi:hypothetical protein
MVVSCIDKLDTQALPVGDGDERRVRKDRNALRLAKARQALHVSGRLDVEHFDRSVPERCDVQSLRGRVDRKVVDAPLDARKVNRGNERQRRLIR